MVDEHNQTPHDEEPEATPDDEINTDNMSAGIISEADFETAVPYDDFDGEMLPDDETEILPRLPDELQKELGEDWEKIKKSDDGYLPDHPPQPTEALDESVDDALAVASKSLEKVEGLLSEAVDKVDVDDEEDAEADDIAIKITDDEEPSEPIIDDKPYRPEPPLPAWKAHAQQIKEDREAKRQKMIEERRAYEAAQREKREAHTAQLKANKKEADDQIKAKFDELREEAAHAVDDMMQRVRDEREEKRREIEAAREQLKREREENNYKKQRDIDNRASRLSKNEDDKS